MTDAKESSDDPPQQSEESLREERRRTGRYVASVIAIFVCLFGLYQAMARGTPEYAAFFLPALIMFIYVLWILYASRHRKKSLQIQSENAEKAPEMEESPASIVVMEPSCSTGHTFQRTYSVA